MALNEVFFLFLFTLFTCLCCPFSMHFINIYAIDTRPQAEVYSVNIIIIVVTHRAFLQWCAFKNKLFCIVIIILYGNYLHGKNGVCCCVWQAIAMEWTMDENWASNIIYLHHIKSTKRMTFCYAISRLYCFLIPPCKYFYTFFFLSRVSFVRPRFCSFLSLIFNCTIKNKNNNNKAWRNAI